MQSLRITRIAMIVKEMLSKDWKRCVYLKLRLLLLRTFPSLFEIGYELMNLTSNSPKSQAFGFDMNLVSIRS